MYYLNFEPRPGDNHILKEFTLLEALDSFTANFKDRYDLVFNLINNGIINNKDIGYIKHDNSKQINYYVAENSSLQPKGKVNDKFIYDDDKINFDILYMDDNYKLKIKDVIYKDDYATNSYFIDFIINYLKDNINNPNNINNILQHIRNKKSVSDTTKKIIQNVVLMRKEVAQNNLNDIYYNTICDDIKTIPYNDLRVIYLYIKRSKTLDKVNKKELIAY